MAGQAEEKKNINKVVYGDQVLIDLTGDTATAASVLAGSTFHDASGALVTGTCDYDSNTKNDTVTANEILAGKTAHARGSEVTGTMANNGAVTGELSTVAEVFSIPVGYHDGSGKVSINADEQAKLVPANVREGITVLGVTGTMSGTEDVTAESPTVTPKITSQTVTPSDGYNYIAQVTVEAIPYSEVENSAGGKTVTIG